MPSGLDAVTAQANATFCQAANTVEHMLSQALQLDAAHPKHITIAQDMARALHYVFSHYSLKAMSVPPMVLSAGAELQEHLDPGFSKAKHTHSHTKSKSKAIITSDDDLELDSVVAAAPQSTPAPAKPLKGVLKRTRESVPNPVSEKGSSYLETDELEEEPMIVGPAPRMGTPYVEIPPAPKFSTKAASPANGLQEDLKADSTSPVWSPACGGCVQQQLICRQGYNTNQELLAVCAQCHCTKHKCGSKGSAAPTKSRKPAARSRSRCRASTVNVTVNSDDKAGSTGNVAATTITAATTAATTTTATTAAIPATTTAVPATTATPSTPTPATTPTAMHVPAPDSQTVLALKEELAVLQIMVASLVERVGTSEQLLQEANWHLVEQEANAKLLTDQVAALQQAVNPTTAESPAAEPLPVVMRTDAAETLAATTAQPEDDLPTTTTPPVDEVLAQQDESPVVVTAMNVDESAPLQITGEQELASIASTAH
ncbi:hypothetical protein EDB19DRAFT_1970983 [Suillus lakei]|nr:hypothetical protein EDB19DRAFT_1970983 [Suillus lakei]